MFSRLGRKTRRRREPRGDTFFARLMIADWASYFYPKHRLRISVSLLLGLIGVAASVATIYAAPLEGTPSLGCGLKGSRLQQGAEQPICQPGGHSFGYFRRF